MKVRITKGENAVGRLFAEPPSVAGVAEYKKLTIVEELLKFMRDQGISRTELAKRMGVQPSRITSMLNGTNNFTIETLVRAGKAVGAELHQTFAPEGMRVRWNCYDPANVHPAFLSVKVQPVHLSKSRFVELESAATDDDAQAA
ncbi:MAG: helix-turn-helix domain-containing protein [Verrucomicrobiae bacterium]|nr:helix-turn-helix domain-containing protein [Verrucomicrobiae bacterium]MCP5541098.1 helix-turn-helix domain-containing protein [Akkermansiaceae bacterium]